MAVTIRDVAQKAGVSISTVSKVIHDAASISESTKRKVRAIMEELSYYPNIIARNFAQQSSWQIGLVMSLRREDAFLNPYIYEILGGIEDVAKKNGYALSLVNMSTVLSDPNALEKLIVQKRVDGLIIHLAGFTKKLFNILEKSGFPYVFIGKPDFKSNACWVDINNTQAGEIATAHLLDQGCKRVAYMGEAIRGFLGYRRFEGYHQALRANGYEIKSQYVKETAGITENVPVLIDELLSLAERPDGLVCSSNFVAFEALKALQKRKIAVPEEMSIVTFDNYPFAPYTTPRLSVVDIDVFELGVQSANALIKKLKNPSCNIQYNLLSPSLIIRESSQITR